MANPAPNGPNGAMSPPPQKPPPFPAYQNSASPPNASPYAPPPAKRPRLSPDPRSPNGNVPPGNLPQYGANPNFMPPNNAFGQGRVASPAQSPYSPVYAGSPKNSFNSPQPYQPQQNAWSSQPTTPAAGPGRQGSPTNPSQMMPPPPRPNKEEKEEKVSADDISDSLYGSGVNLKDEENYMHNMFNNRHRPADSFTTNQSASFGSSTMSLNNSFNLLTQGTSFGSQAQDGPFAGTLGEPQSQEQIEQQERMKRAQAATARNEKLQYHLNHPFLEGNCVRRRLDARARSEGVLLPTQGLYVRTEPETRVMTNGAANEGIVAVRPESLVEQGSQFDHLLSLISLAANERLRGLIDEAYTLARARRYGDHGRVPPEFADIAEGEGRRIKESVVPESISGTQWDKIPDSALSPNALTGYNDKSATPQPQSTFSFQGRLNTSLRNLAEEDRKAEEARIKKREARRRAAENATNPATTGEEDILDPSTPNASDAGLTAKLSKKEQAKRDKASKEGAEAQSHTTTNATAAMMAMGKKASKYSWLSGGSMPTNRFAKPSASGTSTPTKTSNSSTANNAPNGTNTTDKGPDTGKKAGMHWGEWREEGEGGKGLQARDLALVLERDGRERKALQRVWNKMR
ncbi:Hypothetical protein R9X50_00617000 [Acrodontium crateriforme]|uniref:Transcription initiation factor TFIID subunit 4 n=1 Tax=Acrodontium crateriforme TaxID=150365 RepID=A0AAQ3MAK9_9PEZI|nr:Hypothetical protein R9X50_00617000 [Acrodontium crateriforme]